VRKLNLLDLLVGPGQNQALSQFYGGEMGLQLRQHVARQAIKQLVLM
jgi:hypothetical protein